MNEPSIVLSLNSGSSSLKFALFSLGSGEETRLFSGVVERADHEAAVGATMDAIEEQKLPRPDAVGHRVVHGGPHHQGPERVDAALVDSLRRVVPFAPLHLPPEIRAIEAVMARHPDLPQVACFDTAFFRGLPEVSRRFPLPRSFHDKGLWRYGFHGLSYEYLVSALGPKLAGRAILAHLGNGASMAALRDGTPVDTTMGLTPTGGFMMGTRTGDLDPGVIFYLLDAGYGARDLERIVNRESGILGVSGSTSDMKTLLERRAHDEMAALAFEMFSYQARKSIGALAAALGGIDTLVFTGGIGQNAAPVRERICAGLECLGIHIDGAKNRGAEEVISSGDGPCVVRVVPTDEELMIARHTQRALRPHMRSSS